LPHAVWLPLSVAALVAIAIVVATLPYVLVERPFTGRSRASKGSAPPAAAGAAPVSPIGGR